MRLGPSWRATVSSGVPAVGRERVAVTGRSGRPSARGSVPARATWLLVLAVAASAAIIGADSGFEGGVRPLSGVNALLYDASLGAVAAFGGEAPWRTTAVVLVDPETLASPGWSSVPRALQQPQLGRLGRRLLEAGARRIGYDLVLAFDPADLPPPLSAPAGYDAPLTDLLAERGGDVVLGADASVAPAPRYAAAAGLIHLGVIDLQTEDDGRARSVANRVRLPDGARRLGFANALAREPESAGPLAGRTFIRPSAPVGQIPHLSASEVEACLATPEGRSALEGLLRGRTVVIGAGLAGEDEHEGPDRFLFRLAADADGGGPACGGHRDVPTGRAAGRMPGAFLQAAAVDELLSPRPTALASPPVRIAANLAVAGLTLLVGLLANRAARLPATRSRLLGTTGRAAVVLLAALAGLAALAVLVGAGGLALARLWIPIGPVAALAAALCVVQTMAVALKRDLALADLKLAFGRWLAPPVIEAALGANHNVLYGDERVITVLIADLNNFTTFCAAHRERPESIVTALNHKFGIAQAAIDRHGGCLDKFDGDAVIAFWNGVAPQADHARRAVAAAVDLIAADRQDAASPLSFKCAVATGMAFVGRYGSDQKSSFSALGEPMNLAARLEKLCRPHGIDIVVGESSVEALRQTEGGQGPIRFTRVGAAELKGFDGPVAFYTVAT